MQKVRQLPLPHDTIAPKMQKKTETCHSSWGYADWQDVVDDFKIHHRAEFKTSALGKMLLDLAWSQWLGCWLSHELLGEERSLSLCSLAVALFDFFICIVITHCELLSRMPTGSTWQGEASFTPVQRRDYSKSTQVCRFTWVTVLFWL